MKITREPRVIRSEGGPYRPTFIETEPMQIQFTLTEEELKEAIAMWLEEQNYAPPTVNVSVSHSGGTYRGDGQRTPLEITYEVEEA